MLSFAGDYSKIASEVRKYEVLYNKSHPDYLKAKLKQGIWQVIAAKIGTINGKKIDSTGAKDFFNSGRKKLITLQKAVKSGSAAGKPAKAQELNVMLKTFSFLKDFIEPSS
jgi:Alcohol dehydrogenase transcription factor Myb/SANT-like